MKTSMKRLHPALPVFQVMSENCCVLYTPGYFVALKPEEADLIQQIWNNGKKPDDKNLLQQIIAELKGHAEEAIRKREQWLNTPFKPECLSIYLSNYCNLSCSYCYASGDCRPENSDNLPLIKESAVHAAAYLVAKNCADKRKPFHLVLQGSGEPTIHWDLVEQFVRFTRQIADLFNIGWFGYIATNGVIPEKKAEWLAENFNLIGLSCDGPPNIHDIQRPMAGGEKTSPFVERTAHTITKAGGQFVIRSTIMPFTLTRQVEIISYLHDCLGASQMRFEPAYSLHKKNQIGFVPHQADIFVENFLAAQHKARSLECSLFFSGVRLDEIHGPYCNVLKNVLHLTPDGSATACFLCTDMKDSAESGFKIGESDKATGRFIMNTEKIKSYKLYASRILPRCYNCINVYHCVRYCPDHCLVVNKKISRESNMEKAVEFRCQVQQKLAQVWILEAINI